VIGVLSGRLSDRLSGEALAEHGRIEIEHADGTVTPLWGRDWRRLRPGDATLIDRCGGPTLDVGSGPGRLTVALAERGVPALGIDVAPEAVRIAQSAGSLALLRDVFSRVPGAGRWTTVLLADGAIGLGGDPAALLRRVAELLGPDGRALVEVQPPGRELRQERVRLRQHRGHAHQCGDWFPWAQVGADQLPTIAAEAGLPAVETWSSGGRWFAALGRDLDVPRARPTSTLKPFWLTSRACLADGGRCTVVTEHDVSGYARFAAAVAG
jgi:SAM-dependent methyltransferase